MLNTTSHYLTLLNTTSHYFILLHTTSHYFTRTSHYFALLHTTSHYFTLLHTTSHGLHTTSHYFTLLHTTSHSSTLWPPSKPPQNTRKTKVPRRTRAGEQPDQSKKTRDPKSHQITPRTHQNTSDDSRTHQEHVQHLQRNHRGEQISKLQHKVMHQPQGHALKTPAKHKGNKGPGTNEDGGTSGPKQKDTRPKVTSDHTQDAPEHFR